ncbi:MAG: hypothetical protein JNK82_00715 [Myxococcaceae bacterium]|nr:hypothetical protein [Myxococcaceae bacterium]
MRKALLSAVLAALAVTACANQKRLTDPVQHSTRRSRQLMVLAAQEARHIPDADTRLTRQLNIANQILVSYGTDGVSDALRQATDTLNTSGPQLTGHAVLAGWVSVAQLSRAAKDQTLATQAATRAVTELERMPDPAERCDYVMGVAEEMAHTLGPDSAIAILEKSGNWASSIVADSTRRSARLAFASALFNLEDYEGGAAMLRKEGDALWSSDAMVALAAPTTFFAAAHRGQQPVGVQFAAEAPVEAQMARDAYAPPPAPSQAYGKSLSFDSVFEGRTSSTAK